MAERIGFAALCIAEALIAWLYCERLFTRRRKLPTTLIAFIVGYLLLFGASLIHNNAIVGIALFFVANGVLLYANFSCTVKIAALHAGFLGAAIVAAEILVTFVISLFGYEITTSSHGFSVTITLEIMIRLLYLMLAFIGAWFFAPQKRTPEEPKMMALFLGLSIVSMLLSVLMMYLGTTSELTRATEAMIVQNTSALLAVNLLFLVLYNHFQKTTAKRLAREQNLREQSSRQKSADNDNYKALQEQYDNQRLLIHDIKNHLHAIEGLAVEGNATEVVSYISELEGGLAPTIPARLSSDPVLNSILVRFQSDCRDKGITFTSDLREGSVAFMDATEVTTLYGNLLSNSIEAAADSAEKTVDLSVVHNTNLGVLLISVTNSCDAPPVRDSAGRMLSRKRGGRTPGLGLRNIERVVQKYRGVETMYYDDEIRRFHHIIQFPVTR